MPSSPPENPAEDPAVEAHAALSHAMELHHKGELHAARELYQHVLELAPDDAGAMHGSGLIAHQLGDPETAIHQLRQSCLLAPTNADFFYNFGAVLRSLGQWEKSCAAFEATIVVGPDHQPAHEALADVLEHLGRSGDAKRLRERAAELNRPREVGFEEALAAAKQWHREGHLDEARDLYDQLVAAAPEHADLLHHRGILAAQKEQFEEALELLQRAAKLDPDNPSVANNLGNVWKQLRRSGDAEACYRRAAALDPFDPSPHNNLGLVLRSAGRLDEAAAEFQAAIRLDPHRDEVYSNLGNLLRDCGRQEEAIEAYRRSIALAPERSAGYGPLCLILMREGSAEEALLLAETWRSMRPKDPLAQHTYASLTGQDVPDRASDDFVRTTFDQMADTFDEHLVRSLDYRAPQLVADAAVYLQEGGARFGAVLDAGCGTGLCGPLLRPVATSLIGVDLSGGMLHHAERRGVYDQLIRAELTAFLQAHPSAFDLIVSADTLNYFGDLAPVFSAAYAALRPDGKLVFTLERAPDDEESLFRLNAHGRYSHTGTAARTLLEAAGFAVRDLKLETLCKESGNMVAGMIVAAVRS